MRGLRSWLVPAVLAAWSCSPAWADYVNPPGWEIDTDFTHQTWDFPAPDSPPQAADEVYVNPFGTPTFTNAYLCNPESMFWDPNAMGYADGRYGMWGGMPFGAVEPDEVAVALTFEIPNHARSNPWRKEIWIQAAYWGSISLGGQVLTVEIASDPNFNNVYVTYDAEATDIEDQAETGAGTSGQFWRFTRAFALPNQPNVEYVRVSLITADSMAVFIDQVSVDTHCVRRGDFDGDQDVDLADFASFQNCYAAGGAPESGCVAADLDADQDVDLNDAAVMVAQFGGPA